MQPSSSRHVSRRKKCHRRHQIPPPFYSPTACFWCVFSFTPPSYLHFASPFFFLLLGLLPLKKIPNDYLRDQEEETRGPLEVERLRVVQSRRSWKQADCESLCWRRLTMPFFVSPETKESRTVWSTACGFSGDFLQIAETNGKGFGDPRSQVLKIICGNQPYHNTTIAVPNFVDTLEKLIEPLQTSGFGIAVTSLGSDTIYGLGQCYSDLSITDCRICYDEARVMLPQCYPCTGGRIFLDGCFLRAENYSFFQEYTGPKDSLVCGNRTRKTSAFRDSTRQAVERVVSVAPYNNSHAQAYVPLLGAATYVIADCWRTLSPVYCRACLENASASIMRCLPWSEGRALNAGCFMRYSDTNFLNLYPEQKNGSHNSTQGNEGLIPIQGKGSSRGKRTVATVSTVSSIAVLVIGAVIGFYIRRHRTIQKKRKGDTEKLGKPLYDSRLDFKYSTLEKATGSFDEASKLGQGGFGTVYKGVLPDGREIAVKRLFLNKKHRASDFYNEVNIISCIEHKNLVRLLGCSFSGPESLLVYEFLPNKSLDFFIFDPSKGKALNWEKRFEIITGTAEGLVYLHENLKARIVHRDIKASNILLDSRFRAKIADFGLARSFQEDKSHISTAIAGTLGYMAPEYISHGQLTEKADVYGFGILMIEIVTGRQNNRSKDSEY